MTTVQTVLSHRAQVVFGEELLTQDGNKLFPLLSIGKSNFRAEQDWFRYDTIFQEWPDLPFGIACDNRMAAFHAEGEKCGDLLVRNLRVFDILMPVLKETTRFHFAWKSGSFRYGYKFTQASKNSGEDVRINQMVMCLKNLAKAANEFAIWTSQARKPGGLYETLFAIGAREDDYPV